jgi:hypothetical protein
MSSKYNYLFKGLNNLNTIDEMQDQDFSQIDNIVLLPFFVNEDGEYPFLMVGLSTFTNHEGSKIDFIYNNAPLTKANPNSKKNAILVESIVDNTEEYLKTMLTNTYQNYDVKYKGLLCKGGILFVIHQLKLAQTDLLGQKQVGFILATITEILNEKCIENVKMHADISAFFSNTMELCLLHASDNAVYETPGVFYSYAPISTIEYDALFGQAKVVKEEYSQNLYYYFGNYEDTVDAIEVRSRNQNMRHCILKHAVFLKKHIVILDKYDYKKWDEDYYDSVVVLEDEIINDNENRQMILGVKGRKQFSTIAYRT